jgi:tripartite-type tricarboxylate transporter receptor subunit TctC
MTFHNKRRHLVAALAGGAGLATFPGMQGALAQAPAWPTKPIRMVVGFPPGGLTDAYARIFADQISAATGQSVVVENKPGAGSIVAIETVAKSPPDGHTLLVTTTTAVWQNRVLFKKLPFDLEKDLVPVTLFPAGPLVVAVPDKLPVKNFAEFVAWAKKNTATMGSYGPAAVPHMLADQTNRSEGTNIATVNYKGEVPMWVDMASGQLQIAVGSYQAFANVQARGVRAIGVTGPVRSPKLPDVPTLMEQGVNTVVARLGGGLAVTAPTGTPEAVLRRLGQISVDGAETEKSRQLRESFSIPDKPKGLEEARRLWREEAPQWIKFATDLGIKMD